MKSCMIVIAISALPTTAASAAVLDVAVFPPGTYASAAQSDAGEVYPETGNSVCAFATVSFRENDRTIAFGMTVGEASFFAREYDPGDSVTVSGCLSGALVDSLAVAMNGIIDLGAFGRLGTLFFDVAADITHTPKAGPVPLTALAAGLAGFGLLRRRMR